WKHIFAGYQGIGERQSDPASRTEERPDLLPLLSDLLEAKDRQLLNHCSRVSFYATLLANRINLTVAEQKSLAVGAFLHDSGKIGAEPSQFTDDEIAMKGEYLRNCRDPEQAAKLVLPLGLPAEFRQIIASHHQRWDLVGYPFGLKEN